MKTTYRSDLKAHLSVDDQNKVRHIRHSQEYWESESNVARVSAETYLNSWAEVLQIPKDQLRTLSKRVSFDNPRQQEVEYQLSEEKHMFDSTTVGYYQTYLNTPVWRKGLSVKIKQNPNRVIGSTNNSEDGLKGSLPDKRIIERYKSIFRQASARKIAAAAGLGKAADDDESLKFVLNLIRVSGATVTRRKGGRAVRDNDRSRLLSGRFFIYKYEPAKRYAGKPEPPAQRKPGMPGEEKEVPLLKVPPVSRKIEKGRAYLVAELIFRFKPAGLSALVWLILVEIETGSILYIECMTCGVNGLVFKRDPMVSSGDLTITSDQTSAVLDDYDFDEVLNDLDPPSGGNQNLSGLYVVIQEEDDPVIAPPVVAGGTDFDFDPRTNDFGAVNAYYHQTELFRTIEDLGFVIADYFDGSTFPIPVDHRASFNVASGEEINAFWDPNGTGGTELLGFCLCDLTDLTNPLGRAVDPYVHWHEMGGHGTLARRSRG